MTNTNIRTIEIFQAQWGYEQTNVTFYQVMKRTAKTVTVCEIRSNIWKAERWGGTRVPCPDDFIGEPMRRTLKDYYKDREAIKINSFITATTWDGNPVEFTDYY